MLFLATNQKNNPWKKKIDKLDFIKIKVFCSLREKATDSEKIFANHISDKKKKQTCIEYI